MSERRSSILTFLPSILLISLLALTVSPGQAARAAFITVTNTNDSGAGSLRQALLSAAPDNTINFAANVKGTIKLTSTLTITRNVTISGPGAVTLRLSGNDTVRIFSVSP